MEDKTIYRFDRRPLNTSLSKLLYETAMTPNRKAADEVSEVSAIEWGAIKALRGQEISLDLPDKPDILLVLSACYAIAQDEKAHIYHLREYNCYFFAWTIAMIVMRHTLCFEIPNADAVKSRLSTRMEHMAACITNKMIDALMKMVLDTFTEFRVKTGKSLNKGLGKRELAAWGMPTSASRFILDKYIKCRLHIGLKKQILKQVESQLDEHTLNVLDKVLNSQAETEQQADSVLWLDKLHSVFHPSIKNKVLEILWDGILDALSKSCGDPESGGLLYFNPQSLPAVYRLRSRLAGKNVMQISELWNEALHAAVISAHANAYGKHTSEKTHDEMFEMAFNAGCAGALKAAQNVVKRSDSNLKTPKRNKMWEMVWEAWAGVWESARRPAQEMAVTLINETLEEMVGWAAEDVVDELVETKSERLKVKATIRIENKNSDLDLSLGAFQKIIREFIRGVPVQTPVHSKNIEEAMARAWTLSRETYEPLTMSEVEIPTSE